MDGWSIVIGASAEQLISASCARGAHARSSPCCCCCCCWPHPLHSQIQWILRALERTLKTRFSCNHFSSVKTLCLDTISTRFIRWKVSKSCWNFRHAAPTAEANYIIVEIFAEARFERQASSESRQRRDDDDDRSGWAARSAAATRAKFHDALRSRRQPRRLVQGARGARHRGRGDDGSKTSSCQRPGRLRRVRQAALSQCRGTTPSCTDTAGTHRPLAGWRRRHLIGCAVHRHGAGQQRCRQNNRHTTTSHVRVSRQQGL